MYSFGINGERNWYWCWCLTSLNIAQMISDRGEQKSKLTPVHLEKWPLKRCSFCLFVYACVLYSIHGVHHGIVNLSWPILCDVDDD